MRVFARPCPAAGAGAGWISEWEGGPAPVLPRHREKQEWVKKHGDSSITINDPLERRENIANQDKSDAKSVKILLQLQKCHDIIQLEKQKTKNENVSEQNPDDGVRVWETNARMILTAAPFQASCGTVRRFSFAQRRSV